MRTDSLPSRPAEGRDAQDKGSGLLLGFAVGAVAVFLLLLGAVGLAFLVYMLVLLNAYYH